MAPSFTLLLFIGFLLSGMSSAPSGKSKLLNYKINQPHICLGMCLIMRGGWGLAYLKCNCIEKEMT